MKNDMELSTTLATKAENCTEENLLNEINQLIEQIEHNAGLAKFSTQEKDFWDTSRLQRKIESDTKTLGILLSKLADKSHSIGTF